MVVPLASEKSFGSSTLEERTLVSKRQENTGSGLKYFLFALVGLFLVVFVAGAGVAAAIAFSIYTAEPVRPIARRTYPTPIPKSTPATEPAPTKNPDSSPVPNMIPTSGPATTRRTLNINANEAWQITDIRTVENEDFTVQATGSYKLGKTGKRVTVRGISGYKNRRIYSQFKTGALLMRTHLPDGSHSNIQQVSDSRYWKNYPNERGVLEFIVNDKYLTENSGNLQVKFRKIG